VTGHVTVVEGLYLQQGLKLVLDSGGGPPRQVLAGQRPEPDETILMHAGEPGFEVRLPTALQTDDDLPDEVGLALRRVAERMYRVSAEGEELRDGDGPVETVIGPLVHEGAVVLYLDTDGSGFNPAMIDSMARIFVEELAPLDVDAEIAAAPAFAANSVSAWKSSEERRTD
jgi:hypothetical protein